MTQFCLLDIEDRRGRPLAMVAADLYFTLIPGLAPIAVPRGYVTNFGTIPPPAYWIVSPLQLREHAVLHDWLTGEYHGIGVKPPPLESRPSRWLSDAVLYDGLRRSNKLPAWKCLAVLAAIRLYVYWIWATPRRRKTRRRRRKKKPAPR